MAHPAKVNGVPQAISVIPFAGVPAREEEGWEGDEEVVIGKVDADGTGRGVPNGEGGGARGDAEADLDGEAGVAIWGADLVAWVERDGEA